jgi:3D-(3,5/4)-trihydroxycyclohexane-1,2-dione acylhydrolase (decyclizing)
VEIFSPNHDTDSLRESPNLSREARENAARTRARAIREAGTLEDAIASSRLAPEITVTVSEGVILGLLRQGVRKYVVMLGHGNTELGEALRIYAEEQVIRVYHCRNEVAMAHAATALRWIYGETSAVVTSIGPGALQAFAGSLAAASNRVGVYHIYGDETTHGEGYNMQQVPKRRQHQFQRLTEVLGESFVLHTPEALREALRRGTAQVHHPYSAGPFYLLLLPINVQPTLIRGLRLDSLPSRLRVPPIASADEAAYDEACELIEKYHQIVIKVGGGARAYGSAVASLVDATQGVAVLSPGSVGVLPHKHARNMHVGGSKGSISGNHAMENGDLLIVLGSRAVCQADCSGTGYPNAKAVININGDVADASHYNRTTALVGDIGAVIDRLVARLGERKQLNAGAKQPWLDGCSAKKAEWGRLKAERTGPQFFEDPLTKRRILTEPTAIRVVAEFARSVQAIKIFDAGDVQANGFQIVEDERSGETFTETGASYMGFAVSALLAAALADQRRYLIAFTGDGCFIMNPQILIDGVVHGVRGMIVVFDNRRMGAISSLQIAQYGHGRDFATSDDLPVDFVRLATAVQGVYAVEGGDTEESEGRSGSGLRS